MKITPNIGTFIKLSKNNDILVLSHKFYVDNVMPISIYYTLKKNLAGESFLLESVEGEEKISRFSFLGFCPIYTFKSKGEKIYIADKKVTKFKTKFDPIYELSNFMKKFKVAPKENLRFFGGFVGYIGYDVIRFYEQIGKKLANDLNTFDTYFIFTKFLIICDHITKQIEILSFIFTKNSKQIKKLYFKEVNKINYIYNLINRPVKLSPLLFVLKKLKYKSNFKKDDFIKAVKKAKFYIKEGEAIQIVLSQRFSFDFKGRPFDAYRYLRILNPSPYMFYLDFGKTKIAGSSPEMLLRCEKGRIITRPIAGTRRRGKDEVEDRKLAENLINDTKERAEHIMLVDLARNDLGRVAKNKSVSVPIFMAIERFSHVMHIVSEVCAKVDDKKTMFDVLISCFPAGTVSGAPKVRAMQIINELEPTCRGIYAGCVGYFSFTNSLDTCIIIRTIVFKNKKAYVQAGAGIVYDSIPEKEYYETLNKAKAQILALRYSNK
ncbi:MAG: anthranilate synthase component I [Candidatus Omnitrophica bacterium]|nr:anthranilate synthase component I [Candidatus Omnitrophota bacterium]